MANNYDDSDDSWDFRNTDYGFTDDDEKLPFEKERRRLYYDDDSEQDSEDEYDEYGDFDDKKQRKKKRKQAEKNSDDESTTLLAEIVSFVKIFIVALIIAFLFTEFIIVNAEVPTGSMKNTIMEGDKIIGFRLSYLFSDPQRGDIVIFKYPDDETQKYVKRIIGIPGDVITISDGHLYVNGELSYESYIREPMITTSESKTYTVPEGHYFMLGDNRNYSLDARYWTNTFVARDKIMAKVVFRYYDGSSKKILSFKWLYNS